MKYLFFIIAITPLFAKEYKGNITDTERKDVHFVIERMAMGPFKCGIKAPQLFAAKKRIFHVHVLDFLQGALERPGDFIAIKNHPSLWDKRMVPETVKSLKEEADHQNLDQHLSAFAKNTRIPLDKIQGLVSERKFEEFLEALRNLAPRPADHDMFDM